MRSDDEQGSVNFPWLHLFGALLVGYFLIVFFYSGNFLNPRGLLGIFETFKTWTKTGVDSAGHGKPTLRPFLAGAASASAFRTACLFRSTEA